MLTLMFTLFTLLQICFKEFWIRLGSVSQFFPRLPMSRIPKVLKAANAASNGASSLGASGASGGSMAEAAKRHIPPTTQKTPKFHRSKL